jgi:hypothetical protein
MTMAEGTSSNGTRASADDDRLDELERAHVEQLARAHEALAAAQDRSYWLDRWGIDLNELMLRPSGRRLRAAVRVVRELARGRHAVSRYARRRRDDLQATAAKDEQLVDAPVVETDAESAPPRG